MHLPASLSLKDAPGIVAAGWESLVELVFPPCCRLCLEPVPPQADFCRKCERPLQMAEAAIASSCRRCGRPAPKSFTQSQIVSAEPNEAEGPGGLAALADGSPPEKLAASGVGEKENGPQACFRCTKEHYVFDQVFALWPYQGVICDIVVASKYSSRIPLADALGRRLGASIMPRLSTDIPDVVTFVPSHFTRQFARGGTSARVLGEGVARALQRKCRSIVKLTRRISKQAWLDDDQRIENVRDAFSLIRSYPYHKAYDVRDKHVLLVDDVLTTGATANEICRVLRAEGARRITLGIVARSLRDV